jgi:uncharacterized membrane protein
MGSVLAVVSKGALVAIKSQVAKQIVSTVVGAIVGAKVGEIYEKRIIEAKPANAAVEG